MRSSGDIAPRSFRQVVAVSGGDLRLVAQVPASIGAHSTHEIGGNVGDEFVIVRFSTTVATYHGCALSDQISSNAVYSTRLGSEDDQGFIIAALLFTRTCAHLDMVLPIYVLK